MHRPHAPRLHVIIRARGMRGFDWEGRQRGGARETCSKGLRARLFLRAAEAEACSGRRGEAASRGESTNINHRAPGSSSGSGVELIGARDVALAAAPVGWGEGALTEPRIESGGEVFGQQLPSISRCSVIGIPM